MVDRLTNLEEQHRGLSAAQQENLSAIAEVAGDVTGIKSDVVAILDAVTAPSRRLPSSA
jgi:hypothetical protein